MRRAYLFVVSLFEAAVVVYVLTNRMDSRVAESAVDFAFGGLTVNVLAYVFGAVIQDTSIFRTSKSYDAAVGAQHANGAHGGPI